jgi:tetratricopeptide (TPR) repeat protein
MPLKHGQHHHRRQQEPHAPVVRPGAVSPVDQLREWIREEGIDVAPIEVLQLPPSERLRERAIMVEPAAAAAPQPRGWRVLRRLYDGAAQLAQHDPWIGHSQALSALVCVDQRLSDDARALIFSEAEEALEAALFTHPREPRLLATMGELFYRSEQIELALSWCERALAIDSGLPWAALLRAHCLRRLERWDDAVGAYDAVPRIAFAGPAAWRMARLVEQRGWCRLRSGDTDGALRDFTAILRRYERDLLLAEQAMSRLLVTAAARAFPDLKPRTLTVARSIRWMWAQDMLEPVEP